MTSKSLKAGRFTAPPDTSDMSDAEAETETEAECRGDGRRKRRKRNANVYDAVAGRVTTTLPLDDEGSPEQPEATHHSARPRDRLRDPTLAPEQVLFARARAPVRYEEADIYHAAARRLPDGGGQGVLPDSDVLKAVHGYASEFYDALAVVSSRGETGVVGDDDGASGVGSGGGRGGRGEGRGNLDECSMDETALLALGILLEEAGREVLGRRGDLVFTEGVGVSEEGRPGDDDGADQVVEFRDAIASKGKKGRSGRSYRGGMKLQD